MKCAHSQVTQTDASQKSVKKESSLKWETFKKITPAHISIYKTASVTADPFSSLMQVLIFCSLVNADIFDTSLITSLNVSIKCKRSIADHMLSIFVSLSLKTQNTTVKALRVSLSTLSLKKAKVEQIVIKETSGTQHFQGVFISLLIISAEEELEIIKEKEKKIKSTLVRISKH